MSFDIFYRSVGELIAEYMIFFCGPIRKLISVWQKRFEVETRLGVSVDEARRPVLVQIKGSDPIHPLNSMYLRAGSCSPFEIPTYWCLYLVSWLDYKFRGRRQSQLLLKTPMILARNVTLGNEIRYWAYAYYSTFVQFG